MKLKNIFCNFTELKIKEYTFLKNIAFCIIVLVVFFACSTSQIKQKTSPKEEPVVIANDSIAYEIIIFDTGFTTYLNTIAKPKGYYSQNYLEIKNQLYVSVWNSRVNTPNRYNPTIYENTIEYHSNVDYGYDVNYKLFNYFEFAQRKYRIQLR
jgi:hypothetical protein